MKDLKRNIWLLAIMAILFSCGKKYNNPDEPKVNKEVLDEVSQKAIPDEDFAMNAAEGGLFEVLLGELAVKKGSKKIKELGQMMIDDHSMINHELKSIAKKKNLDLPTSLGNEKQSIYDDLMEKDGKAFDKAYADLMVKDHKKDIDKFEKEADKGEDADFKNFAREKLPTLKHHLQMAEDAKKHCDAL